MDWQTIAASIISGLLGAIGGVVGGVAATIRALGQNRNEATSGLSASEARFREALLKRVDDLEAANADYPVLKAELAQKIAQVETLAGQVYARDQARARLMERVATLEGQTAEVPALRALVVRLTEQVGVCEATIKLQEQTIRQQAEMLLRLGHIEQVMQTVQESQQESSERVANGAALTTAVEDNTVATREDTAARREGNGHA